MHTEKALSQCFLKARLLFPRDLEIRLISRSHFLSVKCPSSGSRALKAWLQSGPQDPISPCPFDHSTSPNPRHGYEHLFGGGGFHHVAACCLVGQLQPQDLVPADMAFTSPPYSLSLLLGLPWLPGERLHVLPLRAPPAPAHLSILLPGFPQSVGCSGQRPISGGSGLVPGRIQHVSRTNKRGERCFVSQLPPAVVHSVLLHLLTCQSCSAALPLLLSLPVVCEWQSEVPH